MSGVQRSRCARRALIPSAETQFGCFSRAQAFAGGYTSVDLTRLGRAGEIVRELPNVFSIAGTPPSWEKDVMVAILAFGAHTAASGRAAARRLGLDGFGRAPIEISTTNHKRCWSLRLQNGKKIVVHRVDDHLAPEIIDIEWMPVTSPRRTIIDLAGMKHPRVEIALDHALRKKITDLGQMWLLLEQEWMRGRRGVAILRDLLGERTVGRAPSDSDLEIIARTAIDEDGLPPPVHQFPQIIAGHEIHIDLAYPEAMLAIELDSFSWHMDRPSFERDRERDNELRALGWTVFRFTWAMFRWRKERVVELIRNHLTGLEVA